MSVTAAEIFQQVYVSCIFFHTNCKVIQIKVGQIKEE